MGNTPLVSDPRSQRIRDARHRFFQRGEAPGELVDTTTLRSWQRCQRLGLDPYDGFVVGNVMDRVCLKEEWARSKLLLDHAQSIMEHVYEQIKDSGSMVILADARGLLLQCVGDTDFAGKAGEVVLRPGASWDEQERGTNAIGTALVEERFVEIYGEEHFLDHNGFLICCAAPLVDSQGQIIGAIDISGDVRAYQPHTRGLVKMAGGLVEKRLFETEQEAHMLLCFHSRPEYLGGLGEGVMALSNDGCIHAINRAGLEMLGLHRREVVGRDFSVVFETPLGALVDHARRDSRSSMTLAERLGKRFAARLRGNLPPMSNIGHLVIEEAGSRPVRGRQPKTAEPSKPHITLTSLATGDARLQLALDRVRKVLGKDIPILIQGESGAGKEMFAKAVHNSGPRADQPFIALNCAAIPDNLIESELFGYLGGAFTGARKEGSVGKIQQAHGGTLFLDEIGDMPLNLQARLLRVLQERSVTPLGATKAIPVDISVICATHRRLREEVAANNFREDLYYRLNGLSVTLPALRDRTDLQGLAASIIADESPNLAVTLAPEVLQLFSQYRWPGNIRQLYNVLRVAIALLDEGEHEIGLHHLPEDLVEIATALPPQSPLASTAYTASTATMADALPDAANAVNAIHAANQATMSLEQMEHETILKVLDQMNGNVSAAARRLGISRNTLYRKIGRL